MILRTIGGRTIPMPGLNENDAYEYQKNVISPLAMSDHRRFLRDVLFWPDDRCKACGYRVWTCVSIHGEKRILDELGPNWPIHVCKSEIPLPDRVRQLNCQASTEILKKKENLNWWVDGWRPIFDISLEYSVLPEMMKVSFYWKRWRERLKVEKKDILMNWTDLENARDRVYQSVAFLRINKASSGFDVSLMDCRLKVSNFICYK